MKVDHITGFLSIFLSVFADDLGPNSSILIYFLLFWELEGSCVLSDHICCAALFSVCDASVLPNVHFPGLCNPLPFPYTYQLLSPCPPPGFGVSSLPLLFVCFIYSFGQNIAFGSNRFLSCHIRTFFLYCESCSTTRGLLAELQSWGLSVMYSEKV